MQLHLEHLSHFVLISAAVILISTLLSFLVGPSTLRDLATGFALFVSMASLSIAIRHRFAITPRFVQVSLQAFGGESDKKYRVVAEVMNIGGRSADKCTCEVMRLCDGGWKPLPEKLLLDFVPVDTPVGKMTPLRADQTFSMFPNTRTRLRNYIPERLSEKDKCNLILKLDANGVVVQSEKFGLPDWTSMKCAQKLAGVPDFNIF